MYRSVFNYNACNPSALSFYGVSLFFTAAREIDKIPFIIINFKYYQISIRRIGKAEQSLISLILNSLLRPPSTECWMPQCDIRQTQTRSCRDRFHLHKLCICFTSVNHILLIHKLHILTLPDVRYPGSIPTRLAGGRRQGVVMTVFLSDMECPRALRMAYSFMYALPLTCRLFSKPSASCLQLYTT